MSKFAVLKVEGLSSSDEDEEDKVKQKSGNKSAAAAATGAKKKKNKKKKRKKTASGSANEEVNKDWKDWVNRDQELVDSAYQHDLEEALLKSRLEEQQHLQASNLLKLQAKVSEQSEVIAGRERKQEILREQQHLQEQLEPQQPEEVKPDFAELLAVAQQQLQEKETIISATASELQAVRVENKRLVSENAQLKSLIQLVEGKRGQGLCEQVSELTQVINELTEHIKVLDADLEKERSRSSHLQSLLHKTDERP